MKNHLEELNEVFLMEKYFDIEKLINLFGWKDLEDYKTEIHTKELFSKYEKNNKIKEYFENKLDTASNLMTKLRKKMDELNIPYKMIHKTDGNYLKLMPINNEFEKYLDYKKSIKIKNIQENKYKFTNGKIMTKYNFKDICKNANIEKLNSNNALKYLEQNNDVDMVIIKDKCFDFTFFIDELTKELICHIPRNCCASFDYNLILFDSDNFDKIYIDTKNLIFNKRNKEVQKPDCINNCLIFLEDLYYDYYAILKLNNELYDKIKSIKNPKICFSYQKIYMKQELRNFISKNTQDKYKVYETKTNNKEEYFKYFTFSNIFNESFCYNFCNPRCLYDIIIIPRNKTKEVQIKNNNKIIKSKIYKDNNHHNFEFLEYTTNNPLFVPKYGSIIFQTINSNGMTVEFKRRIV